MKNLSLFSTLSLTHMLRQASAFLQNQFDTKYSSTVKTKSIFQSRSQSTTCHNDKLLMTPACRRPWLHTSHLRSCKRPQAPTSPRRHSYGHAARCPCRRGARGRALLRGKTPSSTAPVSRLPRRMALPLAPIRLCLSVPCHACSRDIMLAYARHRNHPYVPCCRPPLGLYKAALAPSTSPQASRPQPP